MGRTKAVGLAAAIFVSGAISLRGAPPVTETNNAPKTLISDASVTNIAKAYMRRNKLNDAKIIAVYDSLDPSGPVKVAELVCPAGEGGKGKPHLFPTTIDLSVNGKGDIVFTSYTR